jgi:hypothetical protein
MYKSTGKEERREEYEDSIKNERIFLVLQYIAVLSSSLVAKLNAFQISTVIDFN